MESLSRVLQVRIESGAIPDSYFRCGKEIDFKRQAEQKEDTNKISCNSGVGIECSVIF